MRRSEWYRGSSRILLPCHQVLGKKVQYMCYAACVKYYHCNRDHFNEYYRQQIEVHERQPVVLSIPPQLYKIITFPDTSDERLILDIFELHKFNCECRIFGLLSIIHEVYERRCVIIVNYTPQWMPNKFQSLFLEISPSITGLGATVENSKATNVEWNFFISLTFNDQQNLSQMYASNLTSNHSRHFCNHRKLFYDRLKQ